ncbi:MAG: hypothetical protein QM813_27425 [Verrucomicrobiota bacterium]
MPTYFKPLRRKLGVVTLVLACVFATEFLQSFYTEDSFAILRNELMSSEGELILIHSSGWSAAPVHWFLFEPGQPLGQAIGDHTIDLSFRRGRFGYHTVTVDVPRQSSSPVTFVVCWLPHLSIVIPLALLSAWLLLSNPRVKTDAPIEPASEGA